MLPSAHQYHSCATPTSFVVKNQVSPDACDTQMTDTFVILDNLQAEKGEGKFAAARENVLFCTREEVEDEEGLFGQSMTSSACSYYIL